MQRCTTRCERPLQVIQTFVDEAKVHRVVVRRAQQIGFVDVQAQHRSACAGLGQGCVIADAEVALEPDEVDVAHGSANARDGRNDPCRPQTCAT